MHVVRARAAEDTHVDVLAGDVAEDYPCDDDLEMGLDGHGENKVWCRKGEGYRWDGKAVCDLLHHGSCGGQSRGGHVRSRVAVDDHCGDDVHDGIDDLQHGERLGEFAGVLHLGDDAEEGDVGDEREDDVGHGEEAIREAGRRGDFVRDLLGHLDRDGDHGDDGSGEDTGCRDEGHPEDLVCCARQGTEETEDQAHNAKDDGAGAVAGDRVEQHGEGEDVACHQEDDEQQLTGVEDFPADSTEEQLPCVAHAVHLRVPELELAHDIPGVP